ncbi:MAG: PepSY-like domain-containing protein [Prevotella sp.]|nr:PepSY-like domain-containing protein [Prevotella sp.]
MKKMKITVFALIGLMTKSMVCKANENMVFAENLPTDAKVFVQKNFPRLSVAFVEKKAAGQGSVYEVSLNDGTEVVFSPNGAWGMVDCKLEAVPASLMPAPLSSFVKSQFAGAKVVRLERTNSGYVAALSNGISLKFDHEGQIA